MFYSQFMLYIYVILYTYTIYSPPPSYYCYKHVSYSGKSGKSVLFVLLLSFANLLQTELFSSMHTALNGFNYGHLLYTTLMPLRPRCFFFLLLQTLLAPYVIYFKTYSRMNIFVIISEIFTTILNSYILLEQISP